MCQGVKSSVGGLELLAYDNVSVNMGVCLSVYEYMCVRVCVSV